MPRNWIPFLIVAVLVGLLGDFGPGDTSCVWGQTGSPNPFSDAPPFPGDTAGLPTAAPPVFTALSQEVDGTDEPSTSNGSGEPNAPSLEMGDIVREQSEKFRRQLDESSEARKYKAGILQPIYTLAEYMSFSSFHWVAFALMVSGVVSFVLQLVLGKLVVLARGGFSLLEILADAQCLLISLVGLVLTTQAAADNSEFTTSPAAVLTSTGVGALAGILFYVWGQSAELEALRGRRAQLTQRKPKVRK